MLFIMKALLNEIAQDIAHNPFLSKIKHLDKKVLAAMALTDRKHFVKESEQNFAYENRPLSIGYGQTISQPLIVALVTHLIEPKRSDKVLEIGAGSGFQVAVLAKLVKEVYGIEIIKELALHAQKTLQRLHLDNTFIICDDGHKGLPSKAPFDKIIISAASAKIPDLLLEQLAIGGIMVLPKIIDIDEEMLTKVKKISSSEYVITDILPVRFVPLVKS